MIQSAKFIKSSPSLDQCPVTQLAEFAFVGRSNVGKSSLINMLTERKSLAKTSGTPGKTQLINHFLVDNSWYLVDLPGYGWAKVSKTEQNKWSKMVGEYLLNRVNLAFVFLLIDIRHPIQKIDADFIQWLGEKEIPFGIVFTKADKLKKSQIDSHKEAYGQSLRNTWEELPPIFVSSSMKKMGRDQILNLISSTLEVIE